ncbi:hypothetical protein HJC23_010226 [Cyclotella cryptica]|uniref:Uncharacterized protein n=1 Tax=Cyclotella cryptica TaxID=29204 RepID=A0ABD3Q122_9STRA
MFASSGTIVPARVAKAFVLLLLASSAVMVIRTELLLKSKPSHRESTYRSLESLSFKTKPFVAIVSCIKSKSDRVRHRPGEILKERFLPSIRRTISVEELSQYRVEVILGYDEDDDYWQQHSNQDAVVANDNQIQQPIPVSFISLPKDDSRPNRIPFNELCKVAYDSGAKYLVRINDDTHFVTPGWLTLAIQTLQSFSPPNIGVVGPTCKGDASGEREILTHDMTYLPFHLSIFDTYYPQVFDNYYVDDWISRVYGANRTKRLQDWEVVHDVEAYGTRYRPTFSQNQYLDEEVDAGKKRVEDFVNQKQGKR